MDAPGIVSPDAEALAEHPLRAGRSPWNRKEFADPCRTLRGLMQGSDPCGGLSFRAEVRQGAVESAGADL